MRNIFLIGFMGCGKSTVASGLQRMYGMKVVEMDQLISERQGMSIPQIFEQYGENYFRDLESELVAEIQGMENQVVSCGGGVVLREQNVAKMKENGQVVLLTAKPETILERVKYDNNRPVLKGRKTVAGITELMEARREKYEAAADIVIHTDKKSIPKICEEIMQKLAEREK
ncbi:MAG: shikimate kinase [Tyzzerella sp.]|nr:shikimate kinase [Tyzzerella sp.]